MSLGSIKAAVVNGISEATACLVNFNLDFSLIKIEAPKEFSPVGAALSSLRRESAESGLVHTTARKLGALFDPLLPDTPQLIKAYGSRASEIVTKSESGNKHTNYGVFESQVGVDATSIWASATSGAGAIKAHLLACILARMWEPGEATAIWDEIVNVQKQDVMNRYNEGGRVDMVSWVVAKQQISRKELRDWDASARAWLCAADKIKAGQQNQFLLAIDRFDLRVASRSSAYVSVIEVWKETLLGLELLVNGSSQELRSVNLLLGLSALHLYPDLNVLTKRDPLVRQNDDLVPGILTIGLSRNSTNGEAGIRWSLPLAHLRYYGDPVYRTRLARVEGSRLTLAQFRQFILGCVIGGWNVDARQTQLALQWIIDLDEQINAAITEYFKRISLIDLHKSWLSILAEAAQDYLYSDDLDRKVYARLLNLGRRKAGLLGKPDRPFFALGEPDIFVELATHVEERILCLRNIAQTTPFEAGDLLIRYRPAPAADYEYATAIPRPKREFQNMEADVGPLGHTRWLNISPQSCDRRQIKRAAHGHYYYTPDNEESRASGKEKIRPLDCELIRTLRVAGKTTIHWDTAGAAGRLNTFKYWIGDEDEVALFCAQDTISPPQLRSVPLSELTRVFETAKPIDLNLLFVFDKALQRMGDSYLASLRAIASMMDLYKMLPGATVDIKAIDSHLPSTRWVESLTMAESGRPHQSKPNIIEFEPESSEPETETETKKEPAKEGLAAHRFYSAIRRSNDQYHSQHSQAHPSDIPEQASDLFDAQMDMINLANNAPGIMEDEFDPADDLSRDKPKRTIHVYQFSLHFGRLLAPFTMTRSEAFACIILLESGRYDIPPDTLTAVMAISSNDSLFIAAPMLCSPADNPPAHEIHHVTGNIGQGGMALLIPPAEPRVRKSTNESWHVRNHDPWDGKYTDHFGGTSLHLSYTGYHIPLDVGTRGEQDWEIYLLESVVSVHEQGEWVADLDILKALQSPLLLRIPPGQEQVSSKDEKKGVCSSHTSLQGQEPVSRVGPIELVAIQNWAEYLLRPDQPSIVVASSNWQAQLAAAAITIAQGDAAYIVNDDACCYCVCEAVRKAQKPGSVVCIS
jgi:hypothetical protein